MWLIPLSRLDGIEDSYGNDILQLPDEKELNKSNVEKLYGCWIKKRGPLLKYDDFISYRWGSDSDFARDLYDSLSDEHNIPLADLTDHRSVDVFMDTRRIPDGTNFQKEYALSLITSTVVTPIVSKRALERMVKHNPKERS
eukprot:gene8416-11383_t